MSSKYDYLVKLLLVGDSGVGKSSLLIKFADNIFDFSGVPTIGIDFKLKIININDKKVKLQLIDTAGQERFRSIVHAHFRNAEGLIFVFDLTNRESFENINYWLDYAEKYNSKKPVKIIIGNKSDMIDKRQVTKEELEKLKLPYFETSAKNDSVDEPFYNISKLIVEQKKNIVIENNNNNGDDIVKFVDPVRPSKNKCCK